MVNRRAFWQKRFYALLRNRRAMAFAASLALALFVGTAILAVAISDRGKSRQPQQVSPAGLGASTPSREYIYAGGRGGRLIAVEQPVGLPTVGSLDPPDAAAGGAGFTLTVTGSNFEPGSTVRFNGSPRTTSVVSSSVLTAIIIDSDIASPGSPPVTVFKPGVGTSNAVTFTVRFTDVPSSHTYYADINKIKARGITTGCGTGTTYCPNDAVTREQLAAFIDRALGQFNPPTPQSQRFNDVPPSNPFYAFIDDIATRGITQGCSSNPPLYCPTDAVVHEQMAAFIERALGIFNPPTPPSQRFSDVPPSNPFYAFIDDYARRGIWNGCGGGNFCPTAQVTRGEMARILVRAFNL